MLQKKFENPADGWMIAPPQIAFDIDGVVADTMTLFLDIARDEFGIHGITLSDITCYTLEECIDMDAAIIEEVIVRLLAEESRRLKPIEGAPRVLTRLGKAHSPVLFVTARPDAESVNSWISDLLPLEPEEIEIVATGSFEKKTDVLLSRNISYFVEDRLETCFPLREAGICPVLFRQPWNRKSHPFIEVGTWDEIESLIDFRESV